ncbi:MAG: dimethylarginine dimethylaminohydrolase family protein [Candidatus Thorarchaeota archaeon SMTZ1-83]
MKNKNKWNELYDVEHPPLVGFKDGEMQKVYDSSSFGVASNYSKLKRLLLHRPSEELNVVKENPVFWLWDGVPNLEEARKEWDAYVDLLKKNGVEIEILEEAYPRCAKQYFCRDQATMTPWGVIISRMALTQRWGEEQLFAKKMWELQIPVLMMVTGDGIFEGGNYIPLDKDTVVIGRGIRCNDSGISQVEYLLELMDIDSIIIDIPSYLEHYGGYVHADVCLNPIDKDLALVYPEGLPYWFLNELRDRGFDMIEVEREEVLKMGTNVLPLDARKVVLAEENPIVKKRLEDIGVKVIETRLNELRKGGGGPRCLVMELLRV